MPRTRTFTSYCWAVIAVKHFYAVLCEAAITSLVLQALQGVHERQVAWLDGKPENVLCTGHGHSSSLRITICDFVCNNHFDTAVRQAALPSRRVMSYVDMCSSRKLLRALNQ